MRTRSGRQSQVDQGTRLTETTETAANSTPGDIEASTAATTAIPVSSSSIVPPYVNDISHPALVKWKRERQEYEDAIEARCATTGEDKSKALRSVKNSFNRQLLKTLCKFEWGTTVEEITEDRIVSELDKVIGNAMNDVILDIDSIFDARSKMDLDQRDEKCRVLKKHLAPAALRDAVDSHLRLVDTTSKSDENALYALVKEKALEQSEYPDLDEAGKEALLADKKSKKKTFTGNGNKRSRTKRNILLVKLGEPIESRAVGGTILTSTHAIDVILTLNTAARPVRCQDQKRCLIVESDEDE
eukprot:jgi/Phyca11/133017/e_gw1.295.2.1